MLAGIGVLIFAGQFHVMVDDNPPGSGQAFGGIRNLATIPVAIWKGLTEEDHQAAASLGVLTILTIVAWATYGPKKLKFVPAPLIGVLVTSITAGVLGLDVKYITLPDNLFAAISLPTTDSWSRLLDWSILGAGLALAMVASAESLLTATAADTMQQHAPRTKYDRELAAQGIGNVLCGFLGALPITGVIVRTGANIQAGAQTRLATMLHGAWLLVFAIFFPFVLRMIPVGSLAAILVYTGYKLVNPKPVKELMKYDRSEVAIYTATLVTVVVVDLLTGILVGLGLALVKLIYTFTHLSVRVVEESDRTILYLEGAATFLRLPKLAQVLDQVPASTELHVHFEELTYIDHACLDLLMNWEKMHEATGGTLTIDWDSLTGRFRNFGKNNTNAFLTEEATDIPAMAKRPSSAQAELQGSGSR
jgi:MFS superfamily sulfate permease-like transporter